MLIRSCIPFIILNSVAFAEGLFNPFALVNDDHFAVTADMLFWTARQEDLSFAIKNKGSTTSINHAKIEELDFNWNFGFRLGLDYKLPEHDQWDLFTRYTYFHGTASESVQAPQAPETGAIFPIWSFPQATSVFADHAEANWFCNLNMADFELGRNCFTSTWLSIRPFLSVRAVVLQQRFHVTYKGGTQAPGDRDKVKMINNTWGVGLRMGFNSLWGLGKGFSIYADGAGSLLSGRYTIHQSEHLVVADVTLFRLRDAQSNVFPIAEVALGLQWDHIFPNNRWHMGVKVGWEMNYFFNQNRIIRFLSSSNPGAIFRNDGDLSFNGVTFGLRFDF